MLIVKVHGAGEQKHKVCQLRLIQKSGGVALVEVDEDGFEIAGSHICDIFSGGIRFPRGYKGSLPKSNDGRVAVIDFVLYEYPRPGRDFVE